MALRALGRIRTDKKVFEDGDALTGLSKEVLDELKKAGTAVSERKYARLRPEDDDEEDDEDEEEEQEGDVTPPAAGQSN
jgi:hypothetical protein